MPKQTSLLTIVLVQNISASITYNILYVHYDIKLLNLKKKKTTQLLVITYSVCIQHCQTPIKHIARHLLREDKNNNMEVYTYNTKFSFSSLSVLYSLSLVFAVFIWSLSCLCNDLSSLSKASRLLVIGPK